MFGTYLNPDKVNQTLRFGIGEGVAPVRLALGV
jgi:hypothetical protein